MYLAYVCTIGAPLDFEPANFKMLLDKINMIWSKKFYNCVSCKYYCPCNGSPIEISNFFAMPYTIIRMCYEISIKLNSCIMYIIYKNYWVYCMRLSKNNRLYYLQLYPY